MSFRFRRVDGSDRALCMRTNFVRPCVLLIALCIQTHATPDPAWLIHDRSRPAPGVVDPGARNGQGQPDSPPSDAVVLFDGNHSSAWVAMDGTPMNWAVTEGALISRPGSGNVRTLQSFGDCQLHVEWAVPNSAEGAGRQTGNSGVLFGNGRYEIQLLDSHGTSTYADGAAASVYGQYPPMVNASRAPGQWQVFDLIWTAPRFDADGRLQSKARITLLHNGVLVQNNVEVLGPTTWISRRPYAAHPERLPIVLQDHGHPVRFRNIWVRELGDHRHPEFQLSDVLLDSYVGDYGVGQWSSVAIRRLPDGLLSLNLADANVVLHAASPTHFYAESADVQCKFDFDGEKKKVLVTVGVDFSKATAMERQEP